ncbi:MAG: hypothetical protein NC930_09715 [Candidatus Omnitrophica bacterium]|nr:hypothetical protein [Candidatus Omnitrophota bacterium]
MNIARCDQYCNEKFSLQARGQKIQDQRKQPVILASTIIKSIRKMPVLGETSLLAMDQYARSDEARRLHASKKELDFRQMTVQARFFDYWPQYLGSYQ